MRGIARSLAIGASAVVLAVGAMGPASADPPNGGCPSGGGWFLTSTSSTIPGFDRGNFHDQNNDGLVCAKQHKDGSWTVKDNTNK